MDELPFDSNEKVSPVDLRGGLFEAEPERFSEMALDYYSKELEGTVVSDARAGPVRFTAAGRQAFVKLPENRVRMSTVKALRDLVRKAVPIETGPPAGGRLDQIINAVVPFRVGRDVYAVRIVLRKVDKALEFEDFEGYALPAS